VEALVAAVRRPVRGAVNVAGEGTIGLTRMVRMAGRPTLPVLSPLFGPVVGAGKRLGLTESFSDDFARLLRYGRGVDTTRLVDEVGYRPAYSTLAAVEDYLSKQAGRRVVPSLRQVVPG
jgi:UDP-glucose 4-epimerase